MRIATWNINSVRSRGERAVQLLKEHDIDVLCLQETKVRDAAFPTGLFEDAGYRVLAHGLNQWNGVAVVSRLPMRQIGTNFGQPGFAKDPLAEQQLEARALGVMVGPVEIWSLYVPNGRELTDRHYNYKLEWLYSLARYAETVRHTPAVFSGDFNVAVRDEDVWDLEVFRGLTHVSEPERAAMQLLEEAGLNEVSRALTQSERFTYYDYKSGRLQRGEGMRIDFHYATASLAATVRGGGIDTAERHRKGSSDHLLLYVDYDVPDFDSVR